MKKLLLLLLFIPLVFSCSSGSEDDSEPPCSENPNVKTLDTTEITFNSAKIIGTVNPATCEGASSITTQGLVYSTSTLPKVGDVDDIVVEIGGVNISKQLENINLVGNKTKYYVRAFCTTISGTYYGEEKSFTLSDPPIENVNDDSGNSYQGIVIGEQVWINSNYKGSPTNNFRSEKYGYVYPNNSNGNIPGYKLPSVEDYRKLLGYVVGKDYKNLNQEDYILARKRLYSTESSIGNNDEKGNNLSGFNAKPGTYLYKYGDGTGRTTWNDNTYNWWTSSTVGNNYTVVNYNFNLSGQNPIGGGGDYFFQIRLIKE